MLYLACVGSLSSVSNRYFSGFGPDGALLILEGLVHIEYSPLCLMIRIRGRLHTGGLLLLGGQIATGQHLIGGHEFGGQPGLGGHGFGGQGLGQGAAQVLAHVGLGLQGEGPQGGPQGAPQDVQAPQLPQVPQAPHEPHGPHGPQGLEQQPDLAQACFCMRRRTAQAMWPGRQPHLNWKRKSSVRYAGNIG